ncbi:MAG: hypothetical protein BJ554DRAFT_5120 [Olpidium bornovanus]|uniref:TANGO6 N-terminal domain-containing protein n=1 Tax=Olpidium bornovanus TaxID=278681 RepID=A0A8H7ZJG3_9FUNG|nr:MAG: hypothetical protein BJ554DRAFT_5120 [Olpidium bornovanus]
MATGRADGPGAAQAASQGAPSLAHALQSAQKLLGNESPGGAGPEKRGLAALLARRLLDAGFVEEESYLSISGQHAVRGRFAFACLAVLEVVHRALVSDATAHLGVRDLRTVRGLLEVVVAWGLLPHFLPAVGVSLARRVRSGNSAVMAGQPLFDPLRDESARLCDLDASISSGRLYQVLSVIMGWVSSAASRRGLSDIVCTKYLADLFAGLAQLSYGPPTCSYCDEPGKVDRDLEPGVADAGTDNLPVKLFRIMGAAHYPDVGPAERDQAKNWLKTLFALYVPLL